MLPFTSNDMIRLKDWLILCSPPRVSLSSHIDPLACTSSYLFIGHRSTILYVRQYTGILASRCIWNAFTTSSFTSQSCPVPATPCPLPRLPPTPDRLAHHLPLCDLGHHTSKEQLHFAGCRHAVQTRPDYPLVHHRSQKTTCKCTCFRSVGHRSRA
jgi:hypothetical protein